MRPSVSKLVDAIRQDLRLYAVELPDDGDGGAVIEGALKYHTPSTGISIYERKFEIFYEGGEYLVLLPLGQMFLEKRGASQNDVLQILREHFESTS